MKKVISFGGGNDNTNLGCVTEVECFLKGGNIGVNRKEQFECVKEWHDTIWATAVNTWGKPIFQDPPQASRDASDGRAGHDARGGRTDRDTRGG